MSRKSVSVTNSKTQLGYDGQSSCLLSQWSGRPFGLVEGKGRQPGLMTAASPWRSLPALVAPPPGLTHVGGNGEERSQAKLGALLRGHDQLFTF